MAIYETFILKDPTEIPDGKECTLEIRDTETYETRVVKAVIEKSSKNLSGGDFLRVRWQRGMALPDLWGIKILEEKGVKGEDFG
jgi:hypothetical protein